jgi:hypothetical protein
MAALAMRKEQFKTSGHTADDLNPFRRLYFKGFRSEAGNPDEIAG